ncbi:TIGR02301 family protein [Rhizobium sp. SL86]|uniref:TIGR02301 family protein n=1 Tax=Rhizobium sp. SL86 TaxID=2995148 RepID=UPI0022732786|nr:TIGR02301 family protein [Rhizobium sp. SL86]MCY1664078.1 TIGR02301 family protein [Rhizobium sp. SL86]
MVPMPLIARVFCILLIALTACPAAAQKQSPSASSAPAVTIPSEEKPAPYDGQLLRLAEILGSVHYLRTLCGADSADWRTSMQTLLDAETPNEPKRREKLTASFNRGYRAFAGVHTTCTSAARQAEERYRNEGATLAAEIAARYGN